MFWGVGEKFKDNNDYSGGNIIGFILMVLREQRLTSVPRSLPEVIETLTFDADSNFASSSVVPVKYSTVAWHTSESLFQAWKVCVILLLFSDTFQPLFKSSPRMKTLYKKYMMS
jgi:predicted NAD-dependent protein-ADP-ribosyltransferase YbiA (DUF1768 family)